MSVLELVRGATFSVSQAIRDDSKYRQALAHMIHSSASVGARSNWHLRQSGTRRRLSSVLSGTGINLRSKLNGCFQTRPAQRLVVSPCPLHGTTKQTSMHFIQVCRVPTVFRKQPPFSNRMEVVSDKPTTVNDMDPTVLDPVGSGIRIRWS